MKSILLVVHPTRTDAIALGKELARVLADSQYKVFTNHTDLIPTATNFERDSSADLAIVLGGDGTILRAAELVRGSKTPIIGINMGSVGFLAEISKPSVEELLKKIKSDSFKTDTRLLLKYEVIRDGSEVASGWALNEVTIERSNTQMVELFVQIDDRPLSRWGCDGVICATPTGSTAYAFSAGGPVLWPSVNAIVLLPLAAHALFSKPMVISPDSRIIIDIESDSAEVSADGMRKFDLERSDRIRISKDVETIQLVHLDDSVFTDRLVAKFKLPVEGWRGRGA